MNHSNAFVLNSQPVCGTCLATVLPKQGCAWQFWRKKLEECPVARQGGMGQGILCGFLMALSHRVIILSWLVVKRVSRSHVLTVCAALLDHSFCRIRKLRFFGQDQRDFGVFHGLQLPCISWFPAILILTCTGSPNGARAFGYDRVRRIQ